jgi:Fe-S oxidoreductase
MDIQQKLHAIESHCIQEEWPKCQAACPLHVDVRGFMAKMAAGDEAGARKLLERTMPVPGVLGRLCEHPCETTCLRDTLGGVLAMGALERACITRAKPGGKPLCMPAKSKRVAILGDDLGALTAAWDLGKKGVGITLFAPGQTACARLAALPADVLPPEILTSTLEMLGRMNVTVKTGQALDAAFLDAATAEYDGVFVEMTPGNPLGITPAEVDPVTLRLGETTLFCAGWPEADGSLSGINMAAAARRAALTLDRFLSGSSLTASRDKEGPCATRTFTNLTGIPAVPRVVTQPEPAIPSPEDSKAEAARCIQCQCLECVKQCAYLEHYKAFPRVYARQIYNNLAIAIGNRSMTKMLDSCMLCGLCTEICPEDFSMADLCLESRRNLVERGKLGASVHEFALEDMAAANSPEFALMRAEPGAATCAHLFFPGCQLGGEPDSHIPEAYAFLRAKLAGGVGLALGCCGIPARWAAQFELFNETMAAFRTQWEALGKPRVITACASCQSAFAIGAPDIPVVSLWRVMAEETGLPETTGATANGPLAVHDPCTSRHDTASQAAVRELLGRRGVTIEELPLSKNMTQCCGFGGLADNAHPELAAVTTARRAAQSENDYVATCAMCRDRLAKKGKRTYHLLDLLFPGELADPAARPDPGFSTRHEEREHLRRHLLATVWNDPQAAPKRQGPELVISPEVRARMEDRRILVDDVAAVVAQAEAGGQKFLDRETGRFLASFRPRRVAFWVDYAMVDGKAVIHNAYCHRMMVYGTSSEARQ